MKIVNVFFLSLFLIQNLALAADGPAESNSIDGQFSTPTNLTDQQMENARTFVHQGQRDRVYDEGCKKIDDCKYDEGFPLEQFISIAYTTIGMFGGGTSGPSLNKPPTQAQIAEAKAAGPGKNGKPKKPETDKQTDYCIIAAKVWEGVAGMIQQHHQKQADNTTTAGDAQLQALVSLQQTHKARQKTSKYQAYVYGGVTACYTGMAFTGIQLDANFWFKVAASGALTTLYGLKAVKHRKLAEQVGLVIDSMEWAGKNCNPWTKTKCFCSESTSQKLYPNEYQEVCILNKGNYDTPKVALGCASVVGKEINYDKECKCKQNNTCLKSGLKAMGSQMGTGMNFMNEANKTFELLNSGEFDMGELDRASLKTMATASRMKMKGLDNLPSPSLTPEQQKLAKAMGQFMPERMAQLGVAARPSSLSKIQEPSFNSASLGKLSPKIRQQLAKSIDAGYTSNGGSDSSSDSSDPEFTMPTFGAQTAEQSGGAEVMDFAEKAQMKAEITNQPSTPIFEIISNRYQRSGWQKLDTQGY
jgi:hypothetical protein